MATATPPVRATPLPATPVQRTFTLSSAQILWDQLDAASFVTGQAPEDVLVNLLNDAVRQLAYSLGRLYGISPSQLVAQSQTAKLNNRSLATQLATPVVQAAAPAAIAAPAATTK